jgi:hypothetical protein
VHRAATTSEKAVENKLDMQTLSAAIAGFLACHVLTCRFLAQEGVIDQERFTAYLETAMAGMSPGLDDQRALFGLHQLINALRDTPPEQGLQ